MPRVLNAIAMLAKTNSPLGDAEVLGQTSFAVAAGACASGAFSGVAGEVAGEILERRIRERLARELGNGGITREEAVVLAEDLREEGVDIARLASGLGAALAGDEVDTVSRLISKVLVFFG